MCRQQTCGDECWCVPLRFDGILVFMALGRMYVCDPREHSLYLTQGRDIKTRSKHHPLDYTSPLTNILYEVLPVCLF